MSQVSEGDMRATRVMLTSESFWGNWHEEAVFIIQTTQRSGLSRQLGRI